MYDHIIYQEKEGIATITFNRPKVLNALNSKLLTELSSALAAVAENEDVRALVLTGAGEKAFVAGADINELAQLSTLEAKFFARKGHQILDRFQALPIPVVAAVNGFALGGGTEIAIACDFIYASEKAVFGQPEIKLGLIPGFGGTQRLARLIGMNMAKEMILTGKMVTATEAKAIGLVNKVCSPDNLMDAVMQTARTMASKGKVSLRAAKDAINMGMNVDLASGCSLEIDAFAICLGSEDAREGTAAFLEKRKPEFKGRLTT
ncbi:MAG: enoyl-CoA hydratase/isomerase family protein [Desulfobacterales bacterium]